MVFAEAMVARPARYHFERRTPMGQAVKESKHSSLELVS